MNKLFKKIYKLIREKFHEQTNKRINGMLLVEFFIVAAIFLACCALFIPKINKFIQEQSDILGNYDIKKMIGNFSQN